MDIRFNHLESMNWLWAVLAVAVVVVLSYKTRKLALRRLASRSMAKKLTASTSMPRRRIRSILVLIAMVLMVFSLLDPRWGIRYQEVQQKGIDVYFVVDTSRSMLAEDVKPNRMQRAKQYIEDVLETIGGDRVGLITYGGQASVTVPLTLDYGAMRLSLDELQTRQGRRGGSMTGDAIRLAMESFTDDVEDFKAIVIFSDGDDMGSYPVEAASQAANRGISVFTVGLGDVHEGGRIPVEIDGQRLYLTHGGEEVWSKLNPDLLQDIAMAAEGAYIPAGTGNVDMAGIYGDVIAVGSGRTHETARIEQHVPRYQWFAALALLLLFIDGFLSDRRTRPKPMEVALS